MICFKNLTGEWNQSINERYAKKNKGFYFDLSPKIFPLGEAEITVKSTDTAVSLEGEYLVLVIPYYDYTFNPFEVYKDKFIRVAAVNGSLLFTYNFQSEQMYLIFVGTQTETVTTLLVENRVYALSDDLFTLKPLIGDLHCHTIFSDGLETPEGVLKAALTHDFDFIAVTDHNCYEGSAEAKRIQLQKNYPITVISGEEYSSSFTNMHIISLGADMPLDPSNYLYDKNTENCTSSTSELTKKLCAKIAEINGVSVMCHPLWKPFQHDGTRGDVPLSLVRELMEENVFDAVEVVAGSPDGDNMTSHLQAMLAMSYGATPDKIAYIGTTDSHIYSIDPICGKHFTIVFAKDKSQDAIMDAIRNKRTIAIQITDKNNALCFGTPRLCMFAQFYIREILKKIK